MAIDYRGLRSVTARELIAALNRDGFYFVRQAGSHRRYAHADGRRVTVAPYGSGDTFTIKTLKSMIERQANWTADDLVRLGLLRRSSSEVPSRRTTQQSYRTASVTPAWLVTPPIVTSKVAALPLTPAGIVTLICSTPATIPG